MEETRLLGFQALEWCDPDWPGDDALPADWAVIATYVDPQARQRGVGRALFAETARAAPCRLPGRSSRFLVHQVGKILPFDGGHEYPRITVCSTPP